MGKRKALESSELYTVGWIAALSKEMTAAVAMLDERHDRPKDFVKPSSDTNAYCWGRIGDHNVVIASLAAGEYGTISTATAATQMLSSFPNIKVGLMVGIGAAIARPKQKRDIRLGDVVVGLPQRQTGGVIQYDLGKSHVDKGQGHTSHTFERAGFLNSPPEALLKALTVLRAEVRIDGSMMSSILDNMLERYPQMAESESDEPGYIYQGQENDKLFEASYLHTSDIGCDNCDPARMISRTARRNPEVPRVHYGVIASGNSLVKDAVERDWILEVVGEDCICLEMEAAGLVNSFPCLVIRGICDYADSHKNDDWQEYAAATAAAYTKKFLGYVDNGDLARTSNASKVLNEVTADLRQMNTNFRITGKAVEELRLNHQQSEIRDWLSAPDPFTNHANALDKRHKDTGLWFIHGETFERWKTQPNSFLWLHGPSGCGKTVLSSTIIEHLKSYIEPYHPLLYFYFDFNDSNKQTLENMLRSLTRQLYQGQTEVRGSLDQLWKSHRNSNQELSRESLNEILLAMLSKVDCTYIVLDALDEASPRSDLLAWVKSICRLHRSARVLVTSRREYDIEAALLKWMQPENITFIQAHDVYEDMRAYISHTVRNSTDLERWRNRPDVQDEIELELLKKADGMFRWVACQLDALKDCLDYPRLRQALENLPETLDETYSRILDKIPREHMHQATTVLNLLIWSDDSLTTDELVDAIAVNPDHEPGFDPRDRMPVPDEVIRLCSGLVVVSRVSLEENPLLYQDDETTNVVRFAHLSVKEYLVSEHVSKAYASLINERVARAYLAKLCLTYLISVSRLSSVGVDADRYLYRKSVWLEFPFARYSSQHWMDHARGIESKDKSLWRLMINLFLESSEALIFTIRIDESAAGHNRFASPISYAIRGGLIQMVEHLLDNGAEFSEANTTATDGYLTEPLGDASRRAQDMTVQLLLDRGADVNAGDGIALRAASMGGHDQTVKILLDKGADVNAGDGLALQEASKWGREAIVQLLLDKGADVNARDGVALQEASTWGYDTIVQLLLDRGADVNAQDGAALRLASNHGERTIVQILLNRGASIKARGKDGKSALIEALIGYHYTTVQLLLDNQTSLSSEVFTHALQKDDQRTGRMVSIMLPYLTTGLAAKKGEEIKKVLHYAAAFGLEAVVQKCLDLGIDTHARDDDGKSALDLAADSGNAAVVKMLERAGSNINELETDGLTAPSAYVIASTPTSAKDGKDLATTLFRSALEASDVAEATRLLEEEAEAITQPTSGFEWLNEPLAMGLTPTEIVNLIVEERNEAPWIRYELPIFDEGTVDAEFHRQNCVHGLNLHNGPRNQEQYRLTHETIDRAVAEMCGLGGVVSLLKARSYWDGCVTFSDKIARVVYRDTDATEVLVSDGSEIKQLAQRSLNALGRVTMLVAWLQSRNLVCDSFVVLTHEARDEYIEAVDIPFQLVVQLKAGLQSFVDSYGERDTSQSQAAVLRVSMTLLRLFCSFRQEFGTEQSQESLPYTIDACALAVQAICTGLLAFSQAHLGELHPFFLMHKVSDVWLCGTDGKLSTQLSLSLQHRELSCIGDMLAGPVMTFVHGNQQPTNRRYNLLTSLENLFELWGPGQVMVDPSSPADDNIRGALIRGGLIHSSSHDSTMFHWSRGPPEEVANYTQTAHISLRDVITIGGFHVNQDCPFKKAFDKSMLRMDTASQPHMLGTFGEFWSLREVQYGSQAGQYALVAINMTWVKTEARTIKSAINNGDWDLSTLEAPWGLLVSVCTGVAQRVPLREVVAEVMPAMVAAMRRRPQEWELLSQNHNIVEKFKDPTFKTWYNSLKGPEQDALDVVTEYILKKIY